MLPWFGAYWIVAVIPAGSGRNWNVIEPVVVRQRGEMLADLRFYFNFDLMFQHFSFLECQHLPFSAWRRAHGAIAVTVVRSP